jgi:hypothetical protein
MRFGTHYGISFFSGQIGLVGSRLGKNGRLTDKRNRG